VNITRGRAALAFVTFVAGVSIPLTALAYPPGRALSVSVVPDMVKPSSDVTLKVNNAIPNKSFKYGFDSDLSKSATSTSDGSKSVATKAPSSAGRYTVKVTQLNTVTRRSETDTTTLFVPKVTIPSSGKKNKNVTISVSYAKPGAIVSVVVGSESPQYRTVSNSFTATVTVSSSTATTKSVVVTVGSLSYTGSIRFSNS